MKNILIITKKELRSFFDNPTAYIVLVVFLLLWEFLFFRTIFLVGQTTLFQLFFLLPWLLLILIPALTMGSISQEKSEGTLELLLTHPLRENELILGKFLASFIFVAIALLFVFPIAFSLDNFGNLDWGVMLGQYLGGIFLAAMLIALGTCISSFFSNQISSLLTTAAVGFFLLIIGFELVTASMPLFLAPLLERLSALSHYGSMARGVIDLRDLWYFVSATLIFLALAYLWLLKRKFGNRKTLYGKYQLIVVVGIAVAILLNIFSANIPGRIDLTQDKLYTLTSSSKKVLAELTDSVHITLYTSAELPAQIQPLLREVKDVLKDYKTLGKGKVIIALKNPQSDQTILQEALSSGISEVQFNVVEEEGFQVKKGFFGLVVTHGEEKESIPFIEKTSELEYQLTSFVKKLTTLQKKKVVFFAGHGEKGEFSEYRAFKEELEKQFTVENARFDTSTSSLPEDTAVVVLAGPREKIDEHTRKELKNFLDNGGAAMILIDRVNVSPQGLFVSENEESFANFTEEYGVKVQKDLVYDLRSNEMVSFGGGFITYTLPYPLWVRAHALDKTSPLTVRIENLTLPWSSSLTLDENKLAERSFTAKKIFSTSKFGGRQTENFKVDPNAQYSNQNLEEQIMAVAISKDSMRILVIGDSDFLADQFTDAKYANLAFGIGAISWLAEEESLADIQLRQRKERALVFENNTQKTLVKYGNMGIALLLPLAFGGFRILRRKALRKTHY